MWNFDLNAGMRFDLILNAYKFHMRVNKNTCIYEDNEK